LIYGRASGVLFSYYVLEVIAYPAGNIIEQHAYYSPVTLGYLGSVNLPKCGKYVVRVVVVDKCGRFKVGSISLIRLLFFTIMTTFSEKGHDAGEHLHPLPQKSAQDSSLDSGLGRNRTKL